MGSCAERTTNKQDKNNCMTVQNKDGIAKRKPQFNVTEKQECVNDVKATLPPMCRLAVMSTKMGLKVWSRASSERIWIHVCVCVCVCV